MLKDWQSGHNHNQSKPMKFLDQFNILNILRNKIWGQFKILENYGKRVEVGIEKNLNVQDLSCKKANKLIN